MMMGLFAIARSVSDEAITSGLIEPSVVMPGLVPGIHVFLADVK
jgi:hypothetical protein